MIPLYDGKAPGSENWTWSETEQFSKPWQTPIVYNVSKPTLTVFQPEAGNSNGTAMVICTGEGFHALSINNEGYDVAKALTVKGVTCFVLKYRLMQCLTDDPATEFLSKLGKKEFQDQSNELIPMAIQDGQEAIAYVRKHAATYHIAPDRIGIIGFSAGGTVTAAATFDYTASNKPNFVIPIYPFFPEAMHKTMPSDAPPMFITVASDDQLNLAPHAIKLYESWLNAKKSVELHVYVTGGHGFGMRKQNLGSDQWIERCTDWMSASGFLPMAPKVSTTVSNLDLALYLKKECRCCSRCQS